MTRPIRKPPYLSRIFFAKAVPRVTAVIGHSNSGASIATAKIYNDAGIAQISPTAWSNKFTDPGHDTVFQMLGDDENGISNTIDHAMNIMQLRRFAVIDDGAILGNSMADIFVRLATAKGAAIVYRDSISNKTFDFNATLNRAKNSGVDMIFFTGRDTQSDQLVRNMVRLKVPAKLLVTDSVINAKFCKAPAPCRMTMCLPSFPASRWATSAAPATLQKPTRQPTANLSRWTPCKATTAPIS